MSTTTICTCGLLDTFKLDWTLPSDGLTHYFDGTECHYEPPPIEVSEAEVEFLRSLLAAVVEIGDSNLRRLQESLYGGGWVGPSKRVLALRQLLVRELLS